MSEFKKRGKALEGFGKGKWLRKKLLLRKKTMCYKAGDDMRDGYF